MKKQGHTSLKLELLTKSWSILLNRCKNRAVDIAKAFCP